MYARVVRAWIVRLLALAIPVALLVALGVPAVASSSTSKATPKVSAKAATTSSLGTYSPTYVGSAADGCFSGCQLLTGPYIEPAVSSTSSSAAPKSARVLPDTARALPSPTLYGHQNGVKAHSAVTVPNVTCQPLSAGCDTISTSAGGAVGVKGLNAVDSAENTPNKYKDIEPPDQGLCAGNGYVVEDNNIGEILIFDTSLNRVSPVISLDRVMGLTNRGWSSGGDISCTYDYSNGGHWFFTEFVSASQESQGGPFAGCFAAVPNTCYEGIAVTEGSSPYGPYKVYFLNANYNPTEPGAPYELNDFAKIGTTRDAFLLFYDEFPLNGGGFGGGFFNGAQEFAFNKTAFEKGEAVTEENGAPNPAFNVAIMNMGTIPTPDGTCSSDNTYHEGGVTCWYSVIPATVPDAEDYDNSHGGSGFMMDTLDFYGTSDNRLAVWDWTGLTNLTSSDCSSCSGIKFGGTLFSGVDQYYDPAGLPSGLLAQQKVGPTPLATDCSSIPTTTGPCPENGIATNGDNITQVSESNGQLWAPASTEVTQSYASNANGTETHMGAVYWVVGTDAFDTTGTPSLTGEGYVSPAHEDLSMPVMAGEGSRADGGNGRAIMAFTLTGNGGPFGADNGGYYPSTAFGRLTATSDGLTSSTVNVADAGQSPQDGFTEYQGYPGPTRPRWGDYSAALFLPFSGGRIYFATNYIQYPNCTGSAFNPNAIGTCGGTRDGQANWGTSVNYVVP